MWILIVSMLGADGNFTQQEFVMPSQEECDLQVEDFKMKYTAFSPLAKCVFDKSVKVLNER